MSRERKIHSMHTKVCPSWFYFSLNNFFRKLAHDPDQLFCRYMKEGQTAIDLGCGPGFFTLGLAKLAGKDGRVFAVDIQQKAIEIVTEKTKDTVYEKTVLPVLGDGSCIPVKDRADFILSFWMLHEVPDKKSFLEEIVSLMKAGSLYLLVEPKMHVSEKVFSDEVNIALSCGMEMIEAPRIALSRAVLFCI